MARRQSRSDSNPPTASGKKPSSTWFLNTLLVVISLSLALLVAEVFVRVTRMDGTVRLSDKNGASLYMPSPNPDLPFVLRPNATGTWRSIEYHAVVHTNSLGYRDDEFALPPDPGEFVVACLGDSMTMGQGVAQDEVFCARAEQELRMLYPNVRIHNMAVSGYGQAMQVAQMEEACRLGARVVLIAVCTSNDVLDNDGIEIRRIDENNFRRDGGLQREVPNLLSPEPAGLERYSRLYKFLKGRLALFKPSTSIGSVPWYTLDQLRPVPSERTQQAFARTTQLLDEFLAECESNGIRLAIMTCPQQYEISRELFEQAVKRYELEGEDYDPAAVARFYGSWCETNNVPFLDMAQALAGADTEPHELFFPIDRHPNPKGHEVMASAVSNFLQPIIKDAGIQHAQSPRPAG